MLSQPKSASQLIEVNTVASYKDLWENRRFSSGFQTPFFKRTRVGLRQSYGMPRNLPVLFSPVTKPPVYSPHGVVGDHFTLVTDHPRTSTGGKLSTRSISASDRSKASDE